MPTIRENKQEADYLHGKLASAVTDYDRKQQNKRGYNMYALSMYLGAVQDACAEIETGTPVRKALTGHFTGRLLDVVLKAAGLPAATDAELREGKSFADLRASLAGPTIRHDSLTEASNADTFDELRSLLQSICRDS